jgi:hypothetical protein
MNRELQRRGNTKRYLLCDIEGGVLDGKHFVSSALEAWDGSVTKDEFFKRTNLESIRPNWGPPVRTSAGRAKALGYFLEFKQSVFGGDSGFSSEDLPSNRVGAEFGQKLATLPDRSEMFDQEDLPNQLPSSLEVYLQQLNPRPPTKAQFEKLKKKWSKDSLIW